MFYLAKVGASPAMRRTPMFYLAKVGASPAMRRMPMSWRVGMADLMLSPLVKQWLLFCIRFNKNSLTFKMIVADFSGLCG